MKGIFLTQEGKKEIEAKIAYLEKWIQEENDECLLGHWKGEKIIYEEILRSSTILPVEESWEDAVPKLEPKQEPCDNCNNDVCCCIIRTQETLEEAAENYAKLYYEETISTAEISFVDGAKWQQEHGQKVGHRVQAERMYSEEDMISFAEFVATYTDKNKNVHGQMLHAKSKYDGAERTVDLFKIWFEQHKRK
jgi:hypothetical protein